MTKSDIVCLGIRPPYVVYTIATLGDSVSNGMAVTIHPIVEGANSSTVLRWGSIRSRCLDRSIWPSNIMFRPGLPPSTCLPHTNSGELHPAGFPILIEYFNLLDITP